METKKYYKSNLGIFQQHSERFDDCDADYISYPNFEKAVAEILAREKAIQMDAVVKVNFAEVIENKKKQIYKSLSEYLGEAEVPAHRIIVLNLMAENECRICDEILAELNSKISA